MPPTAGAEDGIQRASNRRLAAALCGFSGSNFETYFRNRRERYRCPSLEGKELTHESHQ